ncbi:universal stress protein [Myxacorys almedinensis]|uniref:Universal stress protein n=1 Tax=Myxacorys almedinensis A TaxID=2690445 RepID=A0A8J8CJN4_9CYAN|nr:universal stress protein [Myxacorys almedinensis]NDJ19173.1 universal stress protein [Myxacorys almedinensis A]
MFQRPLICTDFTDGLQRLVHFIPALAMGGMTQIVFLHVVPLVEKAGVPRADTEKMDRAQEQLAIALNDLPAGVDVKVEVQAGKAVDAIVQATKTYEADVILLGTQSRNLLTEKLFGSTTIALAKEANIPLFTIRPQLISTYTSEELNLRCQHLFRDVLLPYDDSDAAKYTAEQIKQLAQANGNHCIRSCFLCWVVEGGGRTALSAQDEQNFITQKLEPLRDQLQAVGIQTEIEVRHGNPMAELLMAAQELEISTIALSSNNVSPLLEWSSPSFANECVRRSMHPVLYFPFKR